MDAHLLYHSHRMARTLKIFDWAAPHQPEAPSDKQRVGQTEHHVRLPHFRGEYDQSCKLCPPQRPLIATPGALRRCADCSQNRAPCSRYFAGITCRSAVKRRRLGLFAQKEDNQLIPAPTSERQKPSVWLKTWRNSPEFARDSKQIDSAVDRLTGIHYLHRFFFSLFL